MSASAQARVFDLYNQRMGTYIKGTAANSYAGQDAFGDSSGKSTTFTDKIKYNYGGEVGLLFPGAYYGWRIGFEILSAQKMKGIEGDSEVGASLMNLDSTVYGFFPKIAFEYYLIKKPGSRMTLSFGGGYGKIKATNDYTMTTAGTTRYTLSSFTQQMSQLTYTADFSVGYEFMMLQNTSLTLDVGYKYAIASQLKYDQDITDFTGTHKSGDIVTESDGSNKKINLGGPYAGLTFRIYFNY